MTRTVSKSEFGPKASEFLRQVEGSGEPLIITDRGRPVVRIVAYTQDDEILGLLRGFILRYDDPLEPARE